MKYRVAIVAALITVLVSGCNTKYPHTCPTTTTIRTKNKALDWAGPVPTTIYEAKGSSC